jgi:dipeptidase E
VNIIAIGGGSVSEGATESIDREFLKLTGKTNPRVLFVPTASIDSEEYCEGFTKAYEGLGAEVELLLLHSGDDPAKIDRADAVYVGGGNTKMMLEVWRRAGVDERLRKHLIQGKPAGGLSAGALCWFRVGNSDWPQYEGIPGVNTDRLDCLGFVDLVLCPHCRDEGFRLDEFREMMRSEEGVGVGLDDCAAIQLRGDSFRILYSQAGAVAHVISWDNGELREETIAPGEYQPLTSLIRR